MEDDDIQREDASQDTTRDPINIISIIRNQQYSQNTFLSRKQYSTSLEASFLNNVSHLL